MGNRKRSHNSDIVDKIFKKVKRYVRKRRRISSSSSSNDDDMPPLSPAQSSDPILDITGVPEPNDEIPTVEIPLESEEAMDEGQGLDPDILLLLGSDPSQNRTFGENLHKDVAKRWQHILLVGLPREEKLELLKLYLPAENCTYMKAPVLNAEVKSALSEITLKRDTYSEQKQNQMSSCIAAIGKALNLALSPNENIPQEIVKTLSDAGRLLCDTHYRESLSRRFTIINCLSKQKRELIKNTKIDDHLFGSNLSDYLKSNKAISSSAAELRYSAKNTQQRLQANTSRQAGTLNARGTPRGSAAEPRVYPNQTRRPQPPPPPPTREHRRVTSSRPRKGSAHPSRRR